MTTVDALIVDLLEWIGPTARDYAEVQEAWRTSCPRLPIWEDAIDAAYLHVWYEPGKGRMVAVSALGKSHLQETGRDSAFEQAK